MAVGSATAGFDGIAHGDGNSETNNGADIEEDASITPATAAKAMGKDRLL